MPRFVALPLLLALAQSAAAQTPARPGPPKVLPPDVATREKIRVRTAELKAALAALPDTDYKPDAEVYAKAAEWIEELEEYFDPKAGEKTLAVLDAGHKRAAELREMKPKALPSWMRVRGKPVIRGYRSGVDGSVQPYAVTLPAEGELQTNRLDIVLHGRDATLTEVKFIHARETAKPVAKGSGFIQLEVYGRGNNGYRWAGETDVWEAVGWFRRVAEEREKRKLVDPAKIVLRGFSMGGAGTWHIGLHRPLLFAAIGPGAGFTTTRGYVKNLPEKLPDYVERCLHIYDAVDYAENAFNVPVVAYSGEKDPQKAAADNIFARLEGFKESVKAVHLVAPGVEHKMPPEWQAQAEVEYAKHANRGEPWRDRVRFVTYTTRYGHAGWAEVGALDNHYDKAVFDGTWTEDGLTIKTTNIRSLQLTGGKHPVPPRIKIDGRVVRAPEVKSGVILKSVNLQKRNGLWQAMGWGSWIYPPFKVKGYGSQGPIDDTFMERFVVVPPSADVTGSKYPMAAFKEFERIWPRYFRGKLPTLTPGRVTGVNQLFGSFVLFGDPQTNPLIANVLPRLPITWTKDELVVNGVRYDPKTHVPVLVYPKTGNSRGYVVINSGHTFKEADLKGTNALLYPRLGDWAVLKPTPTADDPTAAEVVAAGLFDDNWQFAKE